MIRKRSDNVKPGCGIDDDLGSDFTKKFNSYRGNYYQPDYPGGTKGGSESGSHEPANERSQPGEYTSNDSGLRNVLDFQFSAESRDIFDDVTANQRPRGDDNWGFDAPGPISHGVNRKQGK